MLLSCRETAIKLKYGENFKIIIIVLVHRTFEAVVKMIRTQKKSSSFDIIRGESVLTSKTVLPPKGSPRPVKLGETTNLSVVINHKHRFHFLCFAVCRFVDIYVQFHSFGGFISSK